MQANKPNQTAAHADDPALQQALSDSGSTAAMFLFRFVDGYQGAAAGAYWNPLTGFRFGLQGAQGFYGIEADLTTLGKVIGGGMPVGAFGGRADIMDKLAPLGPVYQAGTLSGNPLAMRAGIESFGTTREGGRRIARGPSSHVLSDADRTGHHREPAHARDRRAVHFALVGRIEKIETLCRPHERRDQQHADEHRDDECKESQHG